MVHQFWLHGVAIRIMADIIFPWTPGIKVQLLGMKQPVFLNNVFVCIGLGGANFGGIHIAVWSFRFPTLVEALLWQIACIYLAVFPGFGTTIYCVAQYIARKSAITDTKFNNLLRPLDCVTLPMYLLARFYLMVKDFRCLAYPPASTFQTVTWPSFVPHVY
jgi:hypothetical protein